MRRWEVTLLPRWSVQNQKDIQQNTTHIGCDMVQHRAVIGGGNWQHKGYSAPPVGHRELNSVDGMTHTWIDKCNLFYHRPTDMFKRKEKKNLIRGCYLKFPDRQQT